MIIRQPATNLKGEDMTFLFIITFFAGVVVGVRKNDVIKLFKDIIGED